MIRAQTFQGQRVAVFGLGRSGLSACRALAAGGAEVAAWDDGAAGREAAADAGFIPVDLKSADWGTFAALVLSPGIPLTHPEPHWSVKQARAAGVEVIGDVEIFARVRAAICPAAPFVAITGTNGKSTTTALIAHILNSAGRDTQMGGNIGVPILDLAPPAQNRIHAIELSSYQIDLMPTLRPSIGVLINISPDHIDRHGSLENYVSIKARVLASADLAIVGVDDEMCRAIFKAAKNSQTMAISGGSLSQGIGVENRVIVHRTAVQSTAPRVLFPGNQHAAIASLDGIVALRGDHNGQNAAAAAAACLALGLSAHEIGAGLQTFPGLPHRLSQLGRAGHVIFVNDSKATNAASTAHALAAFDSNIYWIAGGRAKDGGITPLSAYFPRIAKAYLIGEAADAFAQTLAGHCAAQKCGTLEAAVRQAAMDAGATKPAGKASEAVVLLSPACASFDQFRNFEARGDAFRALVSQVPGIAMRKDAA